MKSFKHLLALLILIIFNNNKHFSSSFFSTLSTKAKNLVTGNSKKQAIADMANESLKKNGVQIQANNVVPQVVEMKDQQKTGNILTQNPKTSASIIVATPVLSYFAYNWFKKKDLSTPETSEEKKIREAEENLIGNLNPVQKIAFVKENMDDIAGLLKKIKDLYQINKANDSQYVNSSIQNNNGEFIFIILNDSTEKRKIQICEKSTGVEVQLEHQDEKGQTVKKDLQIKDLLKEFINLTEKTKFDTINTEMTRTQNEINKLTSEIKKIEEEESLKKQEFSLFNSSSKKKTSNRNQRSQQPQKGKNNNQSTINNPKQSLPLTSDQSQVTLPPRVQELQTKIETLEKKIAECQSQIKFKESETQIVDNLYKIFVHLYVILRDEYDTNQIYQISDKNQFKVLSPTQDMKMFKQKLSTINGLNKELHQYEGTVYADDTANFDLSFIDELKFAEFTSEMDESGEQNQGKSKKLLIPANTYKMQLMGCKTGCATFNIPVGDNPILIKLLKDKQLQSIHQVNFDILHNEKGVYIQIYCYEKGQSIMLLEKNYKLYNIQHIINEKTIDFIQQQNIFKFLHKMDSFIDQQKESITQQQFKTEQELKDNRFKSNTKKLTPVIKSLVQNIEIIKQYEGFHGILNNQHRGFLASDFQVKKQGNGYLLSLSDYKLISFLNSIMSDGKGGFREMNTFNGLGSEYRLEIYLEEISGNKIHIKIDHETFQFENKGKSMKIVEKTTLFDKTLEKSLSNKLNFIDFKPQLESINYSEQLNILDTFWESINYDYEQEEKDNQQITNIEDKTDQFVIKIEQLAGFAFQHLKDDQCPYKELRSTDEQGKEQLSFSPINRITINNNTNIYQGDGFLNCGFQVSFNHRVIATFKMSQFPDKNTKQNELYLTGLRFNQEKDNSKDLKMIDIVQDNKITAAKLSNEDKAYVSKAIDGIVTALIKNNEQRTIIPGVYRNLRCTPRTIA